jgi:serine/threonine protein kinase
MDGHLEPDVFHGFISGTLSPEARDLALTHLDTCASCRKLLSALASEEPPDGKTIDAGGLTPTSAPRVERSEITKDLGPRKGLGREDPTNPTSRPLPRNQEAKTQESGAVNRRLEIDQLPAPDRQVPSDKLVGHRLGDYVVEELIAKGGMGAVYRGVQPVIRKQVAIKVLLTSGPTELDYAQRMLEEARTVNSIGHPNIIDIFNFGELPDGRPWLVMEYLDGLSISQWVRARTNSEPPVERVIAILEQICAALEAAHVVGVVHRDLKPANVMLTQLASPQPKVKVLDFGFAKRRDTTLKTAPDMVLGTPGYMAPEQIQGQGSTAVSDLYSLGLLGSFMLTGADPYYDKSPIRILQMQLEREPASLRGRPGVPDSLAQLIADLCRIDPALRPQSATEVRVALRSIAEGVAPPEVQSQAITQPADQSHPPAPAIAPKSQRRPLRPDLAKTEPERLADRRTSELEDAVDGALDALNKGNTTTPSMAMERRSVKASKGPWIAVAVLLLALGIGAFVLLR